MEPQQVGRYLIQERLGQGGIGVVYKAFDPLVNRPVALKVIPLTDRVQREVSAAGNLSHPNIVTVFDTGKEGDIAFIVMELVLGGTLAAHLRQGLTWRQIVTLLLPICQALDYAHSRGVIHRDLKPANILITQQGIPKLTDFGLAHVETETALTPRGMVLGTPGYMAPEQLRGETPDSRSDLFSLGVILFEAVAGRHPFEADSVHAIIYQIISPDPVNLEPLADKSPPNLRQVIRQALAKDRQARYATCAELAAALTRCLLEEGGESHNPPPANSGPSLKIRHAVGVSLSEAEENLLARAFTNSGEVFVEQELHAGFGGSRVLLIRLDSGQIEVGKEGTPANLEREWAAYQTLVENSSPLITARIQGKPTFSDDGERALLRYTFVGGDPRQPACSLRTYYQEKGALAAAQVLDRVVRVYGRQWWLKNNVKSNFTLSAEYDRLLPVHLKLQLEKGEGRSQPGETALALPAGQVSAAALRTLKPGQRVRLLDFTVSEIRQQEGYLTLTAPPPAGEASPALRLRVEKINPAAYHLGDRLAILDAVTTETRHSLLVERVQTGLAGLDPTASQVRLGETTYPNPLAHYPDLLEHTTDAKFSIIHGDLNLENILVDRDTGFAWLIDFADTRQGPTLYDFQRLEAQVITKLLSPAVNQAGLGPEVMVELYRALHADPPETTTPYLALQEPYIFLAGIRRLSRQFLVDDKDWDEYFRGLILVLLGTFKFNELDPTALALAFTGAAAAQELIGSPPGQRQLEPSPPLTSPPSALKRGRLLWIIGGGFLLTLALGVALWLLLSPLLAGPQQDIQFALVAGLSGPVEVRRQANEQLEPAMFGLDLFWEDTVLTYEEAAASILCQNGLLFNVGSSQTLVVRCQESGAVQPAGRLEPQLSAQLVRASGAATSTLPSDDTRAPRAEVEQTPLLLSPRHTVITDTRPTFSWQPVVGASGYRLTVNPLGGSGETWSIETTAASLPYPADAPPLAPGSRNSVTLMTLDNDRVADKSLLQVLDAGSQAELVKAEAEIRALPLDEAAQTYLLAQLYRQWELQDAAIVQLEQLINSPPLVGQGPGMESTLRQQLGDLYFEIGLYAQAEEHYQAALTATQNSGDLSGQAAASAGLARVTYVFEETEHALDYLSAAEALYRQAGQIEQAERIAAERAKLKP